MDWKFTYSAYRHQLTLLFISILGYQFSYGLQPVTEAADSNYFQNFSLSKQDDKITVAWSGIPVQQNAYYEIERAEKFMKFKAVGILFPKDNNLASGNYVFKDNLKRTGKIKILYYRIKLVNANQESIYSSVKSVNLRENTTRIQSTFFYQPVHNYSYCAEKQLRKKEINNKVAGILRNTFVSVGNNYITKNKLA